MNFKGVNIVGLITICTSENSHMIQTVGRNMGHVMVINKARYANTRLVFVLMGCHENLKQSNS